MKYDLSKRRGLGATLGRDELASKTVKLEIREDPQEKPSHRNTWIQFPEGWNPCEPKPGGWMRCQDPPVFKTSENEWAGMHRLPHLHGIATWGSP